MNTKVRVSVHFIDLFSGIGGFHLAMQKINPSSVCVLASDINPRARDVYQNNHGLSLVGGKVQGDIRSLFHPETGKLKAKLPAKIDVLTGGFPCQPFSKSGAQVGAGEDRGILFLDILNLIKQVKPRIVFLENVRNLVGPKHYQDPFLKIISLLRDAGYRVSAKPTIYSPHLLPSELGGAPQIRDRVFIFATYVGPARAKKYLTEDFSIPYEPFPGWSPEMWNVSRDLVEVSAGKENSAVERLSDEKQKAIEIWEDFVKRVGLKGPARTLPGFPIWEFALVEEDLSSPEYPQWKNDFLSKNRHFYLANAKQIDQWRSANPGLADLSISYRKLEWQAGELLSITDSVVQFRPSGVRVKKPTYLPALVAIKQTPYLGELNRHITLAEACTLQGFPSNFDFTGQTDSESFKQLGNAVNVGVVSYIFQKFCEYYQVNIEGVK